MKHIDQAEAAANILIARQAPDTWVVTAPIGDGIGIVHDWLDHTTGWTAYLTRGSQTIVSEPDDTADHILVNLWNPNADAPIPSVGIVVLVPHTDANATALTVNGTHPLTNQQLIVNTTNPAGPDVRDLPQLLWEADAAGGYYSAL